MVFASFIRDADGVRQVSSVIYQDFLNGRGEGEEGVITLVSKVL